jgi:hypothetical protein
MRVFARALTACATVALLAGCGGGSGSPIGSAGLPAGGGIVPTGATVTATYKAVRDGKPFQGAEVWLRKCNPTGPYIRKGKTDAKGKIEWSGFKLNQYIELGFKAKVTTQNGWRFSEWKGCFSPGNVPLKDTFHV